MDEGEGAWSQFGSVISLSAAAEKAEHYSHAPRSPRYEGETRKAGGTVKLPRASCPHPYLARDREVTGDMDPNPNPGGHYRGLLNQAHGTFQRRVTSGPGPHRLLLLSFHSCVIW